MCGICLLLVSICIGQVKTNSPTQVWDKKNLNISKFRNGDVIPEVKTKEEWASAGKNKQPAWCYYDNNPDNGLIYGKLYNWFAVNDPRGLSPMGWHIPTDAEWMQLQSDLKSDGAALLNFIGKPAGYRDYRGSFWGFGTDNETYFWNARWTITEGSKEYFAKKGALNYQYPEVICENASKEAGYYVRCVKGEIKKGTQVTVPFKKEPTSPSPVVNKKETTEVSVNYKLYPFSVEVAQKKLWGYKDRISEKVIIYPKYTSCGTFNWGDYSEVEINGKKGILYKTGKEICPLKYNQVYSEKNDGLFLVMTDKYGFIDSTGKEIIPLIYSTANPFNSGRAFVEINEKKFFINNKGKEVINAKLYDETNTNFSEGLCGVFKNKKWGFIDINGKLIVPFKYDNIDPLRGGFALVNIGGKYETVGQGDQVMGGKWGFIDKTGKEVIPLIYNAAKEFSDGLAAIKSGEKWGFIDGTGKIIIPIIYNWIRSSFINGTAEVYLKPENFKIDKTGKRMKEK